MARPYAAAKPKEPTVSMSERRRELARKGGPAAFAKIYLPHLLVAQDDIWDKDPERNSDAKIIIPAGTEIDFADFHRDIFNTINSPAPRGLREAIIAPRGFAKSTTITIIVLYWAAFQLRKFVLWTSETASQVEELVASFIDEIESNDMLREDFPHLLPAKDNQGHVVKWTDRDVVMLSGFRLSARGRRKATRGLRRGGNRPDVVICDDAEGEDSVGDTQYPKTRHWLTRVIGPALSPSGDIIWMNTLVEWTSITGALIRRQEDWTRPWNVTRLEAEWDETLSGEKLDPLSGYTGDRVHKLLWADYWPQERIDGFREEFGELAYMFELRNRPMAEGEKMFRSDWLKWFEVRDYMLFRQDNNQWINSSVVFHVTAIDPAFGGKDYAAVCTIAVFNNDFFVREIWWERGPQIRTEQVVEAVRQAKEWKSRVIVVESVAAQIMVADETIRQTRTPVLPVHPVKSKTDRALPVAVRASQGHVYFESGDSVRHGKVRELRKILTQFPSDIYDDPVDAFVMAIEGGAELKSKYLVAS